MTSSHDNDAAWITGAKWVLLICLVGFAFVVKDLRHVSISSGDNRLWMPEGTRESRVFKQFTHRFGAEDMLLISWDGCKYDDPLLADLANRLRTADSDLAYFEGRERYFRVVNTWIDVRKAIPSDYVDAEVIDSKIQEQLRGFLVGADGETGVILLEGTAYCTSNREEAFTFVEKITREFPEISADLRYSGPMYLSVCASRETRRTITFVTPLVALVSLLVALVLLRSFALAFLSFSVSGMAALMSIAAIHYSGKDLGDLLAVVPSLSQLLAMSNAIHFINYYGEDLLRRRDKHHAWRYALQVGWLPTITASVTTIIGIAALATSNLGVADDFAIYGSIGVCCAAASVLLIVPSVLILFRPDVKEPLQFEDRFVSLLMELCGRYRVPVACSLAGLFLFCSFGVGRLQSDVQLESFFPHESKFQQDHRWFADHFAPPQLSEIMVSFPASIREVQAKDRFAFVENLSADIEALDPGNAVFSAAVFAAGVPQTDEEGRPLQSVPKELIHAGLLKNLRGSDWIKIENEREYWRISVRHPPSPTPEASKFLTEIGPVVARAKSTLDPQPSVAVTGAYKLFASAQNDLLAQLLRTFLYAFVIITPVIIIFLRCFNLGLIAILGNLFPLVVFFGAMGWLGQRIDISTMMIAAVAFGIAVDDTVHFLTWLGRGLKRDYSMKESIRFAFENCAGAILQTTLIISIGMMMFLLCDFQPSERFAIFTSIVLLIALIGDLIFLPSLINSLGIRKLPKQIEPSLQPVVLLGRGMIRLSLYFKELGKLISGTVLAMISNPPRPKLCLEQAVSIGLQSQLLIVVTGTFTGAVFAAQMYFAFSGYGLGTTVGAVVSISVCRELAPVLTALMISGRIGTAMTAEIGAMKSSQQIDALKCMGVNPVEYLVVPRFTGMLLTAPVLNVMAMGCGIIASQFIAMALFQVPSEWYSYQTWVNTNLPDLAIGMIKGGIFGTIVVFVACHQGLKTPGGTDGISQAVKSSVVATALMVVVMNLFLSLGLNLLFPLELRNW